jgi:hypothetical protein
VVIKRTFPLGANVYSENSDLFLKLTIFKAFGKLHSPVLKRNEKEKMGRIEKH